MALRDQPYFPLYVQDFLTDEKLNECSAESVGVYIKIMCVMHKSKEYGSILLKQKDKQDTKQEFFTCLDFAYKLVKHLPYQRNVVCSAIEELVEEDVLQIDGNKLSQKRMVKDNEISLIRAKSGRKGGKVTQFAKAKVEAKIEASTEYEYEYENEYVNCKSCIVNYLNLVCGTKYRIDNKKTVSLINARFKERYCVEDFKKVIDIKFKEWGNNFEMVKYLRPETLFGTKFESYLNQSKYNGKIITYQDEDLNTKTETIKTFLSEITHTCIKGSTYAIQIGQKDQDLLVQYQANHPEYPLIRVLLEERRKARDEERTPIGIQKLLDNLPIKEVVEKRINKC